MFSHNDIQENNVMISNKNKTKLTMIDFEYSMPNFRGFDIAAYINESYIDYHNPEKVTYKMYEDTMMSFEPNGEVESMCLTYL